MVLVVSGLLLLVVSLAAPDLHPTFAAMRDYLSSRESMLGRGLSALEAGDRDEAIRWLEEAVREDPGVRAWSWLGHALDRAGRLDEAIEAHERAVRLDPGCAAAWINFGITWRKKHELDKAMACYDRAMKLDPGDEKLHASLGVLFLEQGRLERAEGALNDAIRLAPEWGVPHASLASVQARSGRFEEAMQSLKRAEKLGYTNTGKVRDQVERIKELRATFRTAQGVKVAKLDGVREGFVQEERDEGYRHITLNVSSGRLNAVVFALMNLVEGPGYLILEVAAPGGGTDAYQLDNLEVEAFQAIFLEFNEFFIHDGTVSFGFDAYQGVDKIFVNRYKTVSILTEDADKYTRRLVALGFQLAESVVTVESVVSADNPARLVGIRAGEKTMADMVAALKERGMYLVEQRGQ
jgi:Flp pilus assembly protein TadD